MYRLHTRFQTLLPKGPKQFSCLLISGLIVESLNNDLHVSRYQGVLDWGIKRILQSGASIRTSFSCHS